MKTKTENVLFVKICITSPNIITESELIMLHGSRTKSANKLLISEILRMSRGTN